MIVFIRPERRQTLRKRRNRLPTVIDYSHFWFYPSLLSVECLPGRGGGFVLADADSRRAAIAVSITGSHRAQWARPGNPRQNHFQALPPRPQWGQSSAMRGGQDFPLLPRMEKGTQECPFFLTKRWPGGRGGSLRLSEEAKYRCEPVCMNRGWLRAPGKGAEASRGE